MSATADTARELDAADPLAPFIDRFVPAPEGLTYLDGNSLGRLPRQTLSDLAHVIEHEWAERLIRGWDEGWMALPAQIGDRLGATLLGAAPGQTLMADSTTVCFYKLAGAALAARPGRRTILTDAANFPTDRYVLEGLAAQHGHAIDWLATDPDSGPEPDAVAAHLSDDTALVSFSHVAYRSAHVADLAAITRLAHDAGALVLWDLSHSAGVIPIELDADGVDLAVGCTYKFLNGGPGAPAYLYVAERLHDRLAQPIQGWFGRADQFSMAAGYEPAPGIARFASGTPPVLALTAARAGIELCAQAGVAAIRAKSRALTAYAIELAGTLPGLADRVRVASPRDPARRGAHVALAHPDARRLRRRLIDGGVIVDFREPDVIRVGLAPLTTRFADVHHGMQRLSELIVQ